MLAIMNMPITETTTTMEDTKMAEGTMAEVDTDERPKDTNRAPSKREIGGIVP
jgi:hypothetical protein